MAQRCGMKFLNVKYFPISQIKWITDVSIIKQVCHLNFIDTFRRMHLMKVIIKYNKTHLRAAK